MSLSSSTCFIVNPQSAGGKTQREWPSIAQHVTAAFGEVAVRFTRSPGDASYQAKAAIEEGHRLLVAVGGDGTNNEVINGMFAPDGTPYADDAVFAFYPSGTGGDLRRSLPAARTPDALVKLLKEGKERRLDLGRITFVDGDGQETSRFFLNIASFGISAEVNRRVSQSSKPFGGTAAFFTASFGAIFSFKNPTVTLQCDDEEPEVSVRHLVAVSNGKYFGGGMKVAPDAEMDDGWFDLVTIGDMSRTELVLSGSKIYKGTHIQHKKNSHRRVKKLVATADADIWLDVDGETPGRLPATFELLPQRLAVRTL